MNNKLISILAIPVMALGLGCDPREKPKKPELNKPGIVYTNSIFGQNTVLWDNDGDGLVDAVKSESGTYFVEKGYKDKFDEPVRGTMSNKLRKSLSELYKIKQEADYQMSLADYEFFSARRKK